MQIVQLALDRHLFHVWWRETWTDYFVRAAAFCLVSGMTVLAFFDPSSLPIGGAGAIVVAILMGLVGAMKALPAIIRELRDWREMELKDQNRREERRPRPRMPDSSQTDEGQTATPPEDKPKVDRVRRRRTKPKPPDLPPELPV